MQGRVRERERQSEKRIGFAMSCCWNSETWTHWLPLVFRFFFPLFGRDFRFALGLHARERENNQSIGNGKRGTKFRSQPIRCFFVGYLCGQREREKSCIDDKSLPVRRAKSQVHFYISGEREESFLIFIFPLSILCILFGLEFCAPSGVNTLAP